jgi:phage tail sheath protein FI
VLRLAGPGLTGRTRFAVQFNATDVGLTSSIKQARVLRQFLLGGIEIVDGTYTTETSLLQSNSLVQFGVSRRLLLSATKCGSVGRQSMHL